ncbi:OsmC family protein [metagenome]|uniref:OsmC family protein n=1 Tax=metagenome TaxID=256318 RepID=A0A2P2C3L3_9ZZZZ
MTAPTHRPGAGESGAAHEGIITMTITTDHTDTNGVDVATLFATLDAVKGQPEIATFQFRATNTWIGGTHSRSEFSGFYGATQEMQHAQRTAVDSDHPDVLVGRDHGPTPVEYLLHGIAACLTAGLANIAAARGVRLHKVSSFVEGDIDLLGIFGLSDGSVRNGYQQIKVTLHVEGDADDETLRSLVEQSRRRSAVYDVLTNPTPVVIDVVTG